MAHNPLIDQTGADCAVGQADDQVWFLPRIAGPRVFSGSRTCTIPAGRAIFLEIGAYVNPYPCPDPNFHPAPGQSLYDFLIADAKAFMDGVNRLDVSLDGRSLDDVLSTGSPQRSSSLSPVIRRSRRSIRALPVRPRQRSWTVSS